MSFITVIVILIVVNVIIGYLIRLSNKRQVIESEAKKLQAIRDEENDLKDFREVIRSEVSYQIGTIELSRLLAGTKFEVFLKELMAVGEECRNETDPENYKRLLEEYKKIRENLSEAMRLDEAKESKKEE